MINFIGGGDPVKIKRFGKDILYSTRYYDDIVLSYLEKNNKCKYVYISSGAVYGNAFNLSGVEQTSPSIHSINDFGTTDFYSVAKFYAEAMHRANQEYDIVDIRVFNIFSRTTNINNRFFITDVARAIYENKKLTTSPDDMVRDYIHPSDFFKMVDAFLLYDGRFNLAVDCYSKSPISKFEILDLLSERYRLKWEINPDLKSLNTSGMKMNYYSNNKIASQFGFEPEYSSADTICSSISAILQEKKK
ncbi:NAD-dependent epimerase/dehydratase family protein [Aeromonas hydrophila]|uniref:NAD-dependent epimerase/dehydratase family protein n=1 Tax=Aeromonas hydrophila TaxID=644 RepID=UPI0030170614